MWERVCVNELIQYLVLVVMIRCIQCLLKLFSFIKTNLILLIKHVLCLLQIDGRIFFCCWTEHNSGMQGKNMFNTVQSFPIIIIGTWRRPKSEIKRSWLPPSGAIGHTILHLDYFRLETCKTEYRSNNAPSLIFITGLALVVLDRCLIYYTLTFTVFNQICFAFIFADPTKFVF